MLWNKNKNADIFKNYTILKRFFYEVDGPP